MNSHRTFVWSDEKTEELRVLRKRGLSCAAIAAELHTSRNSVTGKLDRLGIPSPHIAAAPKKPRAPRRPKAQPAIVIKLSNSTPPAPIRVVPPAPNSIPISILDVQPHHCRSVLEQREQRGRHMLAMFCGDQKTAGSSYCAFHDRLYRAPPKDSTNGKARAYQ